MFELRSIRLKYLVLLVHVHECDVVLAAVGDGGEAAQGEEVPEGRESEARVVRADLEDRDLPLMSELLPEGLQR